ncbi:beta strand repeat-containing protein [Silvibacterium acidisoli]|uniref:beta strand repeat-containing protein n=1 Tax=Acidobacteriaceae bacterium ZG23-2 TaxID=2883246 RepID=UPI00406C4BB8
MLVGSSCNVLRKTVHRLFVLFAIMAAGAAGLPMAWAASATSTTLAVTSAGNPVSSVATGSVVTLTATVVSGGTPVTPGLVKFCNASAPSCVDGAILATAQLNASGTASYKLRPGIGNRSYRAIFVGTTAYTSSSSPVAKLAVTGQYPTTTSIVSSGSAGDYTLTANVTSLGSGTIVPTGDVAFLDTTNGDESIGTATLGASTQGPNFTKFVVTTSPPSIPNFGMAVGDFNGDGIPDLVATNGLIGVLLGAGDGTFSLFSYPPTGSQPGTPVVGDFNGDGILDLAVPEVADNTVSILLGSGDGNFTLKSSPSVGSNPSSAVVGDFNNDGNADLAVVNGNDNTLSILLGNGDGTFTLKSSPAVGSNPASVTAGDFNGDGILDLATADCGTCHQGFGGNTLTILLGKGDGTFTLSSSPEVGYGPSSVAAGDFNGDGITDLAVTNSDDYTLSILLGKGDGTFTLKTTFAVGIQSTSIVVNDFNGDGVTDLAIANSYDSNLQILTGKGDGTFSIITTPKILTPESLVVADFNGDGAPDLAAPSATNTPTITVVLNRVPQTATAVLSNIAISSSGGNVHQVEASFPGNATLQTSVSGTIPLLFEKIATTILLTASPNPSPFSGANVTLTATLSPYTEAGFITDGETITFLAGSKVVGSAALSSGVATLNTTAIPPGTNTVTATFAGDSNFSTATSNAVMQQVSAASFPAFVVTVATDTTTGTAANCTGSGSANCSLRDALAAVAAAGAGNITFDPSVFTSGPAIAVANNTLTVPSNTIITGPNTSVAITPDILGDPIFTINAGTVNVTIANISITSGGFWGGGGVYNNGVSTVRNFSVLNAYTQGAGVGVYNDTSGTITVVGCNFSNNQGAGLATYPGLAVVNLGTMTMIGTSVNSNSVRGSSAPGISNGGNLTMINSGVGGNVIYDFGDGAGIDNGGTLNMTSSSVSGNQAPLVGNGSGIHNSGKMTITNSIVSGNSNNFGDPPNSGDPPSQEDDCDGPGCPVNGVDGNVVGPNASTSPGGNALCAGLLADLPAGITTDINGAPRTSTYSTPSGNVVCLDSGNTQSDYALAFTSQPPATVAVNTSFSAALLFSLNGKPYPYGAYSIPIGLAAQDSGTLNTAALMTDGNGNAASSTLQVNAAGSGDTLVATLPITTSPPPPPLTEAITISAVSSPFNVTADSQTITFTTLPSTAAFGAPPITLKATASSGLTVTYSATGPASISGSTLTITGAGTVVVTASQAGNGTYAAATPISQTIAVAQASTATALTSSTASGNQGTAITFTATVTSSIKAVPTGTVQFLDGTSVLGSSQLNAQGVATYATSAISIGSHTIQAVYSGDANFSGSSGTFTQVIIASGFSLAASPSSLSVAQGKSGQVTITLTPTGGYTGSVTIGCSGAPANATCTLSPSTLTADGSNTAVSSTLTIATDVASSSARSTPPASDEGSALRLAFLPAGVFAMILFWQRKKLGGGIQCVLWAAILLGACTAITACGGGSMKGSGNPTGPTTPTTPAGTSTLTVTATAGGGEMSTINVAVTVTQ